MKIAIYMKFYVDAADIFKCILSSPRFHTEKAKWSYVLKREGARLRHRRSETGELPLAYTHTTRCPPHQSPQHSVQVCSLSFLYSVRTSYKTVLKSYIEHLNSPGYLKLLGFTTCKHRVLFFLSLLCEKELCYVSVQIYSSSVLSPPSSTKLIHFPLVNSACSCSVVGLKLHSLYTFLPRVKSSESRPRTACSQLPRCEN